MRPRWFTHNLATANPVSGLLPCCMRHAPFSTIICLTAVQAEEGAAATALQDAVSHFTLRLAFCTSEENRRWLLAQETELFRLRYAALDSSRKVCT